MKRSWLVGFVCAAILTGGIGVSAQAASVISGPVINPANGHSYYLLSSGLWEASETAAQALGGHLVTVNDQAENDWVWNTFTNFGADNFALWIGYHRTTSGGPTWAWSSGETPGFENWYPGEPNNATGAEDYAAFVPPWQSIGKQWFDMYASTSYVYPDDMHGVVEVANLTPTPLPPSLLLLGSGLMILVRLKKRFTR
jgi:hypothetical protein